jgi:hypothetical protein
MPDVVQESSTADERPVPLRDGDGTGSILLSGRDPDSSRHEGHVGIRFERSADRVSPSLFDTHVVIDEGDEVVTRHAPAGIASARRAGLVAAHVPNSMALGHSLCFCGPRSRVDDDDFVVVVGRASD